MARILIVPLRGRVGSTPDPRPQGMILGVLFHLPSDVQRLEPVLRRLPGASALVGTARWAPARRDSLRVVRAMLRARGWVPLDHPHPGFDLILTTSRCPEGAAERWLHPWGQRVVLDVGGRALPPSEPHTASASSLATAVAAPPTTICVRDAASAAGVSRSEGTPVVVTGDPWLDPAFEFGAEPKMRGALGIDPSERILSVVLDELTTSAPFAAALSRLRTEGTVVLVPTEAWWLSGARLPRVLTGPGFRFLAPDARSAPPALFGVSDLVVTGDGAEAEAALGLRRSTLGVRRPTRSWSLDTESVAAAEDLVPAARRLLREPVCAPDAHGDAVKRLARVVHARGESDLRRN